MATSEIEIANMALGLINEPEIQTIVNPTDKNERILSMYINEVIEEICSYREWNFCTKVVQFAEDVDNDVDYYHRYVVPNTPKTLRCLGFQNQYGTFEPEWERRGNFIVTNESECFMRIIFKPEHIKDIPAYMIRAIVTMLASRIAIPVLGVDGGKLAGSYESSLYNNILPNAVMLDDQEGHRKHIERSSALGGLVIDGDFTGDIRPVITEFEV